ncbi:uncharacterized protein LOC126748920 [Anthonomus grandis grandis]|uniref:uncharacterized protein LOC126748920 n=1 Tax=Anthonomus grandis grandis TaxID=2921223 RepID=UPI002166A0E1|nr:uncharacterized protein LOC126748920 [Anthonomus grandis grandis]
MAVPFNMPEDQNEVEVLLLQLQTLINKLQVAVRRNQQQSSNSVANNNSRVRSTSRARSRDSPSTSSNDVPVNSPMFPDLLTHLSMMAGSSTDSTSSPLTAISVRPPRQRTSSTSSNNDETKISITAIVKHDFYAHDCNKIESLDSSAEPTTLSTSEGIFSKLTPASVSSCSLMTAMICFVGWHIFRAR